MRIQYLEIVTKEVDAVMGRVRRGERSAVRRAGRRARQRTDGPDARRWIPGVRAPLRETERPWCGPTGWWMTSKRLSQRR